MHFLANIPIGCFNKTTLKNTIQNNMALQKKTVLFFANTNFIVKLQRHIQQLTQPDVLIVNDGVGVDIAAWLVLKAKFLENLNGTDFTPFLLNGMPKQKLFLIGSTQADLIKATHYFNNTLNHQVVGICDGFNELKDPTLIARINASQADIVLVGMGNPLQEQWILAHYQSINAQLFMGIGALFVFLAGNQPRAPKWIQQLRLEWCFRLLQEPKRLAKRYTIDIVYFLYLCIKNKQAKPLIESH